MAFYFLVKVLSYSIYSCHLAQHSCSIGMKSCCLHPAISAFFTGSWISLGLSFPHILLLQSCSLHSCVLTTFFLASETEENLVECLLLSPHHFKGNYYSSWLMPASIFINAGKRERSSAFIWPLSGNGWWQAFGVRNNSQAGCFNRVLMIQWNSQEA